MGVRNCAEIGENLHIIIERLMANQNLLKLLYYTDKDPLSKPDFTRDEINSTFFEKLIKVVPRVGPKETATSLVALRVASGIRDSANTNFRTIKVCVEVFCPLTQWIIKDTNLRPFKIMGEIQQSLNGKKINGLGTIIGGDFELNFLSDEISCYQQEFFITTYD